MEKSIIKDTICRSILNRSGIPGIDYTINPYLGCLHGCVYCYARFMTRFSKSGLPWGRFCEVKVNAAEVLRKQLLKAKTGLVSLSTVTDPYQALEKKYGLTRAILLQLADSGFPVSILTKSDLVLRDIDVLGRFDADSCEVGFSVVSPDDDVRKAFEPGAPSIGSRIEAIKNLHLAGIRTWVFLAPALPYLVETGLAEFIDSIAGSADRLLVDRLNIKCGNWQGINRSLAVKFPSLMTKWRDILFSEKEKGSYYVSLYEKIASLCSRKGIPVDFVDLENS
ncbi:MAG TPA: radical SAM protein [bacterium]